MFMKNNNNSNNSKEMFGKNSQMLLVKYKRNGKCKNKFVCKLNWKILQKTLRPNNETELKMLICNINSD